MFDRHQERLAQLRERVLVVEFAGAAGTLASLGTAQGNKGFEVQAALADELGLGGPRAIAEPGRLRRARTRSARRARPACHQR
jgi:adenylosuccinate lyase